jgi:hypothetical protein
MLPNLYLYLTEVEWVQPWVAGGPVPLNVASAYLSRHRAGTMTPDETRVVQTTGRIPNEVLNADFAPFGFDNSSEMSNVMFRDVRVTGFGYPAVDVFGTYSKRTEDGAILCFSRSPNYLWVEAGKKACVVIKHPSLLLEHLNATLGTKGTAGVVRYSDSVDRGHFLKHKSDAWQNEYRMFWKGVSARTVDLPAGVGECVMP